MLRYLLISIAVLASLIGKTNTTEEFNNRVNMALRQTGHQLFLEQGDTTSMVPKVVYLEPFGFLLPLERSFNYSALPKILEEALSNHKITESYELIVQECGTEIPFLGFNKEAFENGDIPCKTREGMQDCANIFIQFEIDEPTDKEEEKLSALLWLMLPFIGGAGLLVYRKLRPEEPVNVDSLEISLGDYRYYPKNQILLRGEEKSNLTFRENKLLHLFASRPNEILTREEILGSVWEDEGIIVGRSMDVFISRLRKLLKSDPKVQINNVHGVGYKLEVSKS